MIDSEVANKLLRYDADTGKLYWRERNLEDFILNSNRSQAHRCKNWNSKLANKEAFTFTNKRGAKHGRINSLPFLAHRIIWLMNYGFFPEEIDHIDGNPSNNKLENLRNVTRKENARNLSRRNKNKIPNIEYNNRRRKWLIRIGTSSRDFGAYVCIGKAIVAAFKIREELGYHKNHGRYNG